MPILAQNKAALVYKNAMPRDKDYTISDGQGLTLLVPRTGVKQWVFRYTYNGKQKKIAIRGGFPAVSVADARSQAEEFHVHLRNGIDPIELRRKVDQEIEKKEAETQADALRKSNTFEKVAREWITTYAHYTPDNECCTIRRFEKNIFPFIGNVPIDDVSAQMLQDAFFEMQKRGVLESVHRTISVCIRIFDYALDLEMVSRNPAANLHKHLLKPVSKHFASLIDPSKVGQLLLAIDGYQGAPETRTALLLGILTFVRPGNLRAAEWENIDFENAEWRIPGRLMKVKTTEDFIVPLAPQAIKLLRDLQPLTGRGKFVFPKANSAVRPMSNNTVNSAYRRMGYTNQDMTGHGVRAMARTLCDERLHINPDAIEAQLAHGKPGPLGSAYNRTTYILERRELMTKYANYLDELREQARRPSTDAPNR